MKRSVPGAVALSCAAALHLLSAVHAEQRAIPARDGDIVLLPADASITVVRSLPGHLRITAHQDGRVLVVLLDEGAEPDGSVDWAYRFELEQPFPRDYAWDGAGTIEEYDGFGQRRAPRSFGVVIPQGRVFLAGGPAGQGVPVPEAIATFTFTRHASRRVRGDFFQVEHETLTMESGRGIQAGVELIGPSSPSGGIRATPGGSPDSSQRPRKIKHADGVLPDAARRAGVQGVVLVEITVDARGHVTGARVLRSIPMLDEAALAAVRQWEFTPAVVDGVPQAVTMTVAVPFGP